MAPPWGDRAGLPAWVMAQRRHNLPSLQYLQDGADDDAMAVVDHESRVHGITGLRIVDASIFPTGPRANLHFTIVAVAEKLADVDRRRPRWL